jgi:hypothetical protein
MSYSLNSTTIRRPNSMKQGNNTQYAANRVLSGANTRDYFGSNKRIWVLSYKNLNPSDFATIDTIYQNYLTNGAAVPFAVSEGNLVISSTNVLIDWPERDFGVPGSTYLSDCELTLTEA